MSSIFSELKRRNVFRVAALYAAVSWGLLQITDVLAPAIALPEWVTGFVALLLIIGFPIAIIFAWAFELTPEGVKRTEAVDESESTTTNTGRRLDGFLIIALVVFGAIVLSDRFLPDAGDVETNAGSETVSDSKDPFDGQPSIAVLPFVDMSPDGDQEYFADGIAEELLNVFAQVKGLSVAGRTSAFAFKGKSTDLREIAQVLDVDHVLEGSVRKAGNQIRVTAQLIQADNGYHLWSATYDGELNDIFGVQDSIAQAILEELTPQLLGSDEDLAAEVRVVTTDLDAYDLYLISKQHASDGTLKGLEAASAALDRAIEIDPNYVPALVWRAYYELQMSDGEGAWGNIPFEEALPRAKHWIDRAVDVAPDSPDALFGLASYFGYTNNDEAAIRYYRAAIEAKPNFPVALNDLAFFLSADGKVKESVDYLERALAHDPAYVDANLNLTSAYALLNDQAALRAQLDRWERVDPNNANRMRAESIYSQRQGDFVEAIRFAQAATVLEPGQNYFISGLNNTLLDIGEYQQVLESPIESQHSWALLFLGRRDEALELARQQLAARPDFYRQQILFIQVLGFAGQWEEVARYFNRTWGDVGAFVEELNRPPFWEMATAMQMTEHPLAPKMLEAYEADIAYIRNQGLASGSVDRQEAVLLLLQGKEQEALALLELADEKGWREAYVGDYPVWTLVQDQDRLNKLLAKVIADIERERQKLGYGSLD
ncbi:hypothetical protein R0137_01875 [Congregibacter brevis]|uniref:Tetratricopeptide repeat protein n=1 Tax=Congregibacter brevis TaxID=3081201 RepID=A0ABZ0IDW8_9GAMM|nr:hypothetical protein R0137_01875 [Congregibacter sp. IMCC45268]